MSESRESKRSGQDHDAGRSEGVAPPPLSPGLWLVPTPIGNVRDITLRALDVLAAADILACEDTRRTRQLMDLHGLRVAGRRMVSYHDRNGAGRRPQIMGWLAEGLSVAYATDAGTPLIADPGYRLVTEAREAGHAIHALPGASAVLTALCTSGLPTDRFFFVGFLPPKSTARRKQIGELADIPATLVFYESPHRVLATLRDLASGLGPQRHATFARELTKRYEEVVTGSLEDLCQSFPEDTKPRGEFVILVAPPDPEDIEVDAGDMDRLLAEAMRTQPVKDAAKQIAGRFGLPRRDVYARAIELRDADDPQDG